MEKIEINPIEGPKKRGRKPGTKNKVKSKRTSNLIYYLGHFVLALISKKIFFLFIKLIESHNIN